MEPRLKAQTPLLGLAMDLLYNLQVDSKYAVNLQQVVRQIHNKSKYNVNCNGV